jgi:glycosyltransferase involved in cell wall biosynthesis
LQRYVPPKTFIPLFFIHSLLWGLYAALVARREGADLYYTRSTQIAYWLVQCGLPTVYEAHTAPKRADLWLLPAIAHKPSCKLIVTLSSTLRQPFLDLGVPSNKILTSPHGVDLSVFKELPSQEACRQRLNLPRERVIIGYIGRFQAVGREKGLPELVQAMACLSVNSSEPLLLCVGGPMDAVPTYHTLARYHHVPCHRLLFVDRVPSHAVPLWMRACDVVVLPLSSEYVQQVGAMPLKLFEYMAAGTPMVATDMASIREIVQHGDSAWLVEPGNVRALAAGISAVLANPLGAQRLAQEALRRVRHYTWQRRARAVLERVASCQASYSGVL